MDQASADDTLRRYYDARAAYYDAGYAGSPPQWVSDMIAVLQTALRGKDVLELACGTGHWTQFAAEVASSITAIDLSSAMLAIARQKLAPYTNVTVCACDAYKLDALPAPLRPAWRCSGGRISLNRITPASCSSGTAGLGRERSCSWATTS